VAMPFLIKKKKKKSNYTFRSIWFCFHNSWILLNRTARTRLKSHVRVEWCWVHDIHTSSLSLSLSINSLPLFLVLTKYSLCYYCYCCQYNNKGKQLTNLLFWFFCQPSWLERLTYSEDI
jgi:hypothetical protein